ncbi:GAF domain-containing protein, partial [bacterium]
MTTLYIIALLIGLGMGALAAAILMARLAAGRAELERRLRDLSVLHEASSILAASLDLDKLLESNLNLIKREFGFQHLSVRLLNERGQLEIRASIGIDRDYIEATRIIPTRGTMFGRAFLDAKPVVVRNASEAPQSTHFDLLKKYVNATALVHIPMVHEDKPIGVLAAYSTRGPERFTDQFVALLQAIANQLALAVVNANLYNQVKTANIVMEERVRQRTAELLAANERLREIDRLKSEFLSNVSHELRTPLTSIQSFSEIFLRYEIDDPVKRKRFAEVINDEAQRLTRMINDLLDLSKIEAGRLEVSLEPVDLVSLMEKTLVSTEALFKKNKLTVNSSLERNMPPVLADADRLTQVINNLLGNAAKFAPERSEVTVRTRRRGRFAIVSVTDQGPGIDPRKATDIFDRYTQIRDPRKNQSLGTGLGLSIARDLVERLGGYI